MANCYVKAYFDWIEQTAALQDAERGRLFIAILEYARSGLEPNLSGRESILFPVFKAQLDRDNKVSASRAASGKLGGEANGSKTKQNEANISKTPNKEKEKEKEEEKDKDKEKEEVISNINVACHADAQLVAAEWNDLGLSQITQINPGSTRAKLLNARIKEHGIDAVLEAVRKVKSSDFLRGQNSRSWVATFDWFIKPNNFEKVLSGNYDRAETGKRGSRLDWMDEWQGGKADWEDNA